MTHPTTWPLTEADVAGWANCSVPDCDGKVAHGSDKCYPHTYGWEAVRKNLRQRIRDARAARDNRLAYHLELELMRIRHRR